MNNKYSSSKSKPNRNLASSNSSSGVLFGLILLKLS